MPDIFDVKKRLTFYGSYHSNKVNVAIHMVGVPLIVWTTLVWLSAVPLPSFLTALDFKPIYLNKYMSFEPNCADIFVLFYQTYYFTLEPSAAILYLPEFLVYLATATSFSHRPDSMKYATLFHVIAWIAQFTGHYVFEGRAPALFDDLLGALVLAPFFVHLEVLFGLGYKKEFHKELNNSVGMEIAKIRKAEAQKKRAAEQKAQ
ncbi:DUF962-domain-containing protein [Serendipita vermifera]|nr:DUF962-domain-containing protein [Serendipita vermifera]